MVSRSDDWRPGRSGTDIMNFSFGCAKDLYVGNRHPRVMIGPDDLVVLRRNIQRGDGRKIAEAIRTKIGPQVKRVLQTDDIASLLQGTVGRMDLVLPSQLHDMALMGVLDEDTEILTAAQRALLALPVFLAAPEKMNPSAYGRSAGVYSMAYGFHPLAYDLLYHRLSASERALYCDWVVRSCIRPAIVAARPSYYKNAGANTPIAETLPSIIGLL